MFFISSSLMRLRLRSMYRWINPSMKYATVAGQREKVVVIMGATGSGKSRLSIHVATRFNGEIINSDKIQVYKGLDVTTNKIPVNERCGVAHHLLGEFDSSPQLGEFTPSHFRLHASHAISTISSRGKLPVIAGGSNSFIQALLSGAGPGLSGSGLRYDCCFLWVDVAVPVLEEYLVKRVDDMIDSGMVAELEEFYDSSGGGGGGVHEGDTCYGIRKAIGVPEFEKYFRTKGESDRVRRGAYEGAVRLIKENTCQLARTQLEKIQGLRKEGWELKRLDGTDTIRGLIDGSKCWSEIWEKQVVIPSMKIVNRFLEE